MLYTEYSAAQLEYELCFVQLKSEMPFPAAGEGFQTSVYNVHMSLTPLLPLYFLLDAFYKHLSFIPPTTLVLWTTQVFRKKTLYMKDLIEAWNLLQSKGDNNSTLKCTVKLGHLRA